MTQPKYHDYIFHFHQSVFQLFAIELIFWQFAGLLIGDLAYTYLGMMKKFSSRTVCNSTINFHRAFSLPPYVDTLYHKFRLAGQFFTRDRIYMEKETEKLAKFFKWFRITFSCTTNYLLKRNFICFSRAQNNTHRAPSLFES